MTAPNLPLFTDSADHSPEERARAVAAILAAGLLRLQRPNISPAVMLASVTQKSLEYLSNHLDVPGEQSVTVHAG